MERTADGGIVLNAREAELLADALSDDGAKEEPKGEPKEEPSKKALEDAAKRKQIMSEKNMSKRQRMIKDNMHLFKDQLHGKKRG